MSLFEKFKIILKRQWLDYYQINRAWIKILITSRNTWVKTPEQGKRPTADIILGAITALEPRLTDIMSPFCELTNNGEQIVGILGLHFDPDLELEKKAIEESFVNESGGVLSLPNVETDELEQIRQKIQQGEL